MIEVRSVFTAEVLGYVPGHLGLNRVGSHWKLELTSKWSDQIIKFITLPVDEFRYDHGWGGSWACLNSDGHKLEELRKIVGWKDAK
ncbi:hypothetical protein [Bacteriophage sp.]|nr:hypothetical protein [Caudoviricetes sp.]UOF80001.1 hypothetical protein [Bacteriophage sp.]